MRVILMVNQMVLDWENMMDCCLVSQRDYLRVKDLVLLSVKLMANNWVLQLVELMVHWMGFAMDWMMEHL